ncbi:helicase C-terminal domain-containing protein [Acidocella sp. KAb 2-4]|uniref:helicase C-terminal domain-containing protein n=1 Tax=Acidocella sp. KAb 2-4 TaxID=2885158 RepID=UPI001D06A19A|nr:helicase C-terminal domain-containing protein [Acidocella sp. KAb 2-4]MCB5944536.1 ATP-dependent DNA helicase [Acidocella sp. KAb 2-4]
MTILPSLPALVAGHGRAVILGADGVAAPVRPGGVARQLGTARALVVHGPATLRRLGNPAIEVLDLLELFAFICPAQTLAPTPAGLARALEMDVPHSLESAALALAEMAEALLARLAAGRGTPANRDAPGLAARMGDAGWGWAPYVLAALGQPAARADGMAMRLGKRLPKWEEVAPRPPPSSFPVTPAQARARLASLLGPGAEQRPAQADYASAATEAFAPRQAEGAPHVVIAEAGTGTGKTMGYLAPASLWAEQNKGAVWISTYTRHLQRQIEQEASRLPAGTRVALRKGRENYLCLLNFEDASGVERYAVPLGLVARWAVASADGDLFGGDLPGWFAELFGAGLLAQIADRRGECIHAACPHFSTCVIERVVRNARQADLVIANHALVMAQAVWGGLDDDYVPTRYVFDEGHHIFDAADSAFAVELSGAAMAELRRWLLGAEGTRSRARGLARRLEDISATDDKTKALVETALKTAKALPAPMFSMRLDPELEPDNNPAEALLRALRAQARARSTENELQGAAGFETDLHPLNPDIWPAAQTLSAALEALRVPLAALRTHLLERLETEPELEETARQRLEGIARGLQRRGIDPLSAWRRILDGLGNEPAPGERPTRIEFLRLDREAGTDRDIALLSHMLDPTEAFIQSIATPAHGLLITSATLRDGSDTETAWENAEARTGAAHLAAPAIRAAFESPFDYAERTRIVLISDVNTQDIGALAGAYQALFQAAGGGGLGLFTAISRLKAVQARIAPRLEEAGIPLYAQHVDAMDNATLVDIFRAEEHSCLLGTDAMRDGVDVPGNALRLVVFERTPWPRPDILHRTRRTHLSHGAPKDYDDAIVRLRLRQAFGRLIRRADDRGVFVLLDKQVPSRLFSAFPDAAPIIRSGLAEAIDGIRRFLETPE